MTKVYDFFRLKGVRVMGNSHKPGRPKTARLRIEPHYHALGGFQILGVEELTHWLSVTPQTAYKWCQAGAMPDNDRRRLLSILALGDVPWPGWAHWRADPDTGQLIAPNGYSFMPGELSWIALIKEQNRELQRRAHRLEIENEELRQALEGEKPGPDLAPVLHFPRNAKND